ncbi:hypothetical protein [Cupriavidus sp. UYPR2.512]|uniref:hypothetical protein n=1 Tax=Cupriavidus sp. UYPR2.512 TaxID=1080187 RepID=UPI0003737C8B|nr:hypothetical protein [Cupriavidus sp. UYPR2.512]UIF89186.1 hypothetical protein KAF44_29825 [Cupriavidus necator]
MPLFNVKLVYRAVIQADDAEAALAIARRHRRDIEGDCAEPRYDLAGTVRALGDLKDGWTESDTPYGSDGSASIGLLLAAECPPERDTRTIDMFEDVPA